MNRIPNRHTHQKRRDLGFYMLVMAFPVIQFLVFYIGVNAKSIMMAFQRIDVANNTTTWTMDNIRNAFQMMTGNPQMLNILSVSLLSYLLTNGIGIPLALFFSYYIYKKMPLHGFFRVILFLPSIISAIVLATIYQFFVERAIPVAFNQFFDIKTEGLMVNPDSCYIFLVFYNVLIGFGTTVLMYSNAMSGISDELAGAAQIDGASLFREFWHVSLPMIFPTLMTFLVAGVATIFTNHFNLFSFFGENAPDGVQTYGYYLYVKTQGAKSIAEYPILSAMGILMTVVVVPVTMLVKQLLEKYGPSED
ncbi:MAG: sugar ABC transporter permease [Oscillospiraceae bacterium]|nr:sugar ABC transporter permease [Oscillospiraceae bacterium]